MKKPNRNYLSFYASLRIVKPPADRPKGYSEHGFHYHDNSIIWNGKSHDSVSLSGYQLLALPEIIPTLALTKEPAK